MKTKPHSLKKRLAALAGALILAVNCMSLTGCQQNPAVSDNPSSFSSSSAGPAPTGPAGGLTIRTANSLETVTADFQSEETAVSLSAARHEHESAQILITAVTGGLVTMEAGGLTGPGTIGAEHIQLRAAVQVDGIPEALVPTASIPVGDGQRAVVWVTVYVPRDAQPGDYTGSLIFRAGEEEITVPLSLRVADFSLPVTPSIPAAMGIWDVNLRSVYRLSDGDVEELKAVQTDYYNYLLDYRMAPYFFDWYRPSMKINAYSLPGGLLDESTMALAKDPRMTALMLSYFPLMEDEFREQMQLVREEGLLDKSMFYLFDEIITNENVQLVKENAAAIKAVEPEAHILTTFFTGPAKPEGNDQWYDTLEVPEVLRGATDIFCMATYASSRGDETVAEKMRQQILPGERFWTYVCNRPAGGYPNIFLEKPGFEQRAVLWRNYAEQATGFLYWSVNHYNSPRLKPNDESFYIVSEEIPKGDGVLLYDGSMFPEYEYEGIVASIRLERLRDSLEDYEYFTLLEQTKGKEAAAEIFKKIYVRPTGYMRRFADIEAVRREIGDLLAGA